MLEVEVSNGSDEAMPEAIPKLWSDLMWAIEERNFVRKNLPVADPSAALVPPYDFQGFEIDDYRIGGMGMVLLGRDPELERKVALKLLQSSGTEADAKLMAEAQALAKLPSHANVVTVYSVHKWEGGVFFAMEFVDGLNGQEWLKRNPAWRDVLDVFIAAGQGLAAAHGVGIQHGDFKPENFLIGADGRTLVADFGIADYLSVEDDEGEPRGRRAGTLEYMAPERLRGHEGDARSDQYSFCASLWSGLHGSRPYRGKTALEVLEAIETGAFQPAVLDAAVPRWLTEVVRKGLAANPDQRYRDMAELLRALADEPPDQGTRDELDEDAHSLADGRRVLHSPAPVAGARRERRQYVVIGFLSGMVVGLGFLAATRSPTVAPTEVAEVVEVEPYERIFAAIGEDDFATVERVWHEHEASLTDAQSLAIAQACIDRAAELDPKQTTAEDAVWTALRIARTVQRSGSDPKVRGEGAQIAAAAQGRLEFERSRAADVRGLERQALRQSGHRSRGMLHHPSGRLFHAFGCGA